MKILDFFRGSSQDRIVKRYITALREAGELRHLTYDAKERIIVAHDEAGGRADLFFVGNLTREIQTASAEDQEAVYRRYALSAVDTVRAERIPSYALVKQKLRILLKDASYPDVMSLQNRTDFPDSNATPLVFEPVVGDVIACCVEERETNLRFVTQGDLTQWNVDAATALADAKANISALPVTISEPLPAWYVFNDDSFHASRLVNPKMFEGVPVNGELVAIVPDRDTFFAADSENQEVVVGLARLAMSQLEAGERIISSMPFVLRDGAWHVYEPPSAIRAQFMNVERQYQASRWSEYKTLLEKDLERRGEATFVASLKVYEQEGEAAHYSMAVWSNGVDTILPRVDRVFFYDERVDGTRFALWDNVVRVMGAGMQREPGLPERYRVQSFPSAEQLVAMGTRSA